MTQENFLTQFLGKDFASYFGQVPTAQFDMQRVLETQRKNSEAVGEAVKLGFEGYQTCLKRYSEIMSQFVEDQSSLAQELISDGTPEEKISKQTALIKKSYDKSVGNIREIADLLDKSNKKATELINKRVSDTLNELQSAIDVPKANTAQKKAS